MNVLIDSTGWIAYFSNGKKAGKYAKYITKATKKTYITPTIVLYEVYKKLKKEASESKANEAIAYMIDATKIVVIDERIALYAAETSIQTGLAMANALIKATADLTLAKVITSDRHFKGLARIEII